jgi:2-C-methyl-D-erythritol 4-phosphate cytidylyltransferase
LPKIYLPLGQSTILEEAIKPFLSLGIINYVVVVLQKDDKIFSTLPVASDPKIMTAMGGATRMESVLSGLRSLAGIAELSDWVLVHDAARANVSVTDLQALIDGCCDEEVGGILACPMHDTVKTVDFQSGSSVIAKTEDRRYLARALTPQQFRYGVLLKALEYARKRKRAVTDEAQAIEEKGGHPRIIWGDVRNIKCTTLADYDLLKIYKKEETVCVVED